MQKSSTSTKHTTKVPTYRAGKQTVEVVVQVWLGVHALAQAHGPGFAEPTHTRTRGTRGFLVIERPDSASWLGRLDAVAAVWLHLALTYRGSVTCMAFVWSMKGLRQPEKSAPPLPPAAPQHTLHKCAAQKTMATHTNTPPHTHTRLSDWRRTDRSCSSSGHRNQHPHCTSGQRRRWI